MRVAVLMLCFAICLPAVAREHESIEQLKQRFETAPPKDKVSLGLRIAELQTDVADKAYSAGKSEEGRAAVEIVVSYTEKAADAASQSGKKLKDAEITVRKISHKLTDIKRTVSFEDQAPVQEAIDRLERIRTQLLSKMFDLGKGAQ